MTCAKCSAILNGGKFCPSCGTPAVDANVSGTQGTPGIPPNVAALLSYSLGLLTGIVFLSLVPYKQNRFVRFHALQSIFLTIAAIAFNILWSVVIGVLATKTTFLAAPVAAFTPLITLAWLAYWIFLMYRAYENREYKIPLLGNLAAKASMQEPQNGYDADSREVPF
jgi:uncharacterized membrane protein